MSSGTLIIDRTSAVVEMGEGEEDYDENDARTMSPRRSSEEIERMGQDARQALIVYVVVQLGRVESLEGHKLTRP